MHYKPGDTISPRTAKAPLRVCVYVAGRVWVTVEACCGVGESESAAGDGSREGAASPTPSRFRADGQDGGLFRPPVTLSRGPAGSPGRRWSERVSVSLTLVVTRVGGYRALGVGHGGTHYKIKHSVTLVCVHNFRINYILVCISNV